MMYNNYYASRSWGIYPKLLLIYIILIFPTFFISYFDDILVYQLAIQRFFNNPFSFDFLGSGFYYLPHFFVFSLAYIYPIVYFVCVFAIWIYLFNKDPTFRHPINYLLLIACLFTGNFDIFICLGIYLYYSVNKSIGWIILTIKPQTALQWLWYKGKKDLCLGLLACASILMIFVLHANSLNYLLSFLRPSIFYFYLKESEKRKKNTDMTKKDIEETR